MDFKHQHPFKVVQKYIIHNYFVVMTQIISLAPLQGLTDYHFRNIFSIFFEGIDIAYTPYIKVDKRKQLSKIKDILPENNLQLKIIPQILTNDAEEFIFLAKYLYNLGYDTVNWNLGCPYPMVAKRKLGSGLLPYPDEIERILENVIPVVSNKISVKMRIGYEVEDEIFKVLSVLDNFPLTEIIIHPRIGKQLYKGVANIDIFEKCFSFTKHEIVYNGDIKTVADFEKLSERFPKVNRWMLGRGVIANPFLPSQIKGQKTDAKTKKTIFRAYHDALFEKYSSILFGDAHILNKMLGLWEYFSLSFDDSKKVYKRIKKAKTIDKYKIAVAQNFNQLTMKDYNEQ